MSVYETVYNSERLSFDRSLDGFSVSFVYPEGNGHVTLNLDPRKNVPPVQLFQNIWTAIEIFVPPSFHTLSRPRTLWAFSGRRCWTFYSYDTSKVSEKRIVEQILQFIIGTQLVIIFYGREQILQQNLLQGCKYFAKYGAGAPGFVWQAGPLHSLLHYILGRTKEGSKYPRLTLRTLLCTTSFIGGK